MNNLARPIASSPLVTAGLGAAEADIFASIQTAIVEQRLLPGTRLTEEELVAIYGVSRMRIRRVLLALAHTGMISLPRGRGAQVARPTADEARAVFAARRLIESALLEAPERLPDARSIGGLRSIVRRENVAAAKHDRAAMIHLSGVFHVDLARACGNPVIADLVSGLVTRSSLIIALFQGPEATCCRSDDHARLLEALTVPNLAQASAFMRAHLDAIEAGLSLDPKPARKPDLRASLIPPPS